VLRGYVQFSHADDLHPDVGAFAHTKSSPSVLYLFVIKNIVSRYVSSKIQVAWCQHCTLFYFC